MSYLEEIRHREELLARARSGEKITPEDRLWLATHRVYNRMLGYPYLNTDIVQIQPGVKYCISIKIESITYPKWIIPVITVPGGKGKIVTKKDLYDLNQNVVARKPVKMLGVLVGSDARETEITYQSNLGLLGISFECEHFDDEQKLIIRKSSDTGTRDCAMLRQVLADNKILYRCKPPAEENFESYVFSIEWTPIG